MKTFLFQEKIQPIGPVEELTVENALKSVTQNLSSVTDSYEKMLSLAATNGAPQSGIDAVHQVTNKYANRIEELQNTDFSTWTIEDLSALSLELSDIITAIREARDLLDS